MHSKEPWFVDKDMAMVRTCRHNGQDFICAMVDQSNDYGNEWTEIESNCDGRDGEIKENARRIVACINACEGVSTEDLEASGHMGAIIDKQYHVIWELKAEIEERNKNWAYLDGALGKADGTIRELRKEVIRAEDKIKLLESQLAQLMNRAPT